MPSQNVCSRKPRDLILNVTEEWFALIKSGKKTMEYREVNPYWTRRLSGKRFDRVIIVCGYPKGFPYNCDQSLVAIFPWRGYALTEIGRGEINYDRALHQLNIEEPDFVYGIKLEAAHV